MKRILAFTFFAIGTWFPLKATHLLGGEITYRALDSVNYRVFVTIYRDCDGNNIGNNIPLTVSYSNSDTAYLGTHLSVSDVTNFPLSCTNPRSKCSYSPGPFGIQKHIFQYDINLSGIPYCEIRLSWEECCRISTLTLGGANQDFYIETLLNKCIAGGSSSLFFRNEIPSLIRQNKDKVITFAGQDSTETIDSVSYSLVNPLWARDSLMQYAAGFSYKMPFTFFGYPNGNLQFPAGFHFNGNTGNLYVRPTVLNQVFTMSVEVKCFKRINGVQTWHSTIHRNYTGFIVSPVNTPSQGTVAMNNGIYRVCAGDSVRIGFKHTPATGTNYYTSNSPANLPYQVSINQIPNLFPVSNMHYITYFPDSSHIRNTVRYQIQYITDSICSKTCHQSLQPWIAGVEKNCDEKVYVDRLMRALGS